MLINSIQFNSIQHDFFHNGFEDCVKTKNIKKSWSLFRQLYFYLSNNSLLSMFQSGFRPKHLTLSALIHLCDELLENMDNGKINCIVFLDVKKAFDSIIHKILLDKMRTLFGISGIQLKRFESYLSNRQQQCKIDDQLSSPKRIKCGVPQGSILGPLFFLLYINDMPDCLQNSDPSLYADEPQSVHLLMISTNLWLL